MIESSGHINPLWSINDYISLKYNQDTVDDLYLNDFLDAGHNRDQMCLFNYFEPNPMPLSIDYIKSQFLQLNNLTAAINLVKPGQYMPYHSDLYVRWKHIHKNSNIKTVVRIIVMLEDAEEGQILHIGKNLYTNWIAGDWYSWTDSTPHAIYNLSLKNRYAVQLTGSL